MNTLYAVMCGGCNEFAALRYPPRHPDWYCGHCTKRRTDEWRPVVGNRVALIDDYDNFSHRYILLAIDGDQVTLRRHGFPTDDDLGRPFTRFVWDLDPVRSPRPVLGKPPLITESKPARPRDDLVGQAAAATPPQPMEDLVRQAAARLRKPDAELPVGLLAEFADWLEECAPQVRGCLAPTSPATGRALRMALLIVGGAS